jgi:hypothetical protein
MFRSPDAGRDDDEPNDPRPEQKPRPKPSYLPNSTLAALYRQQVERGGPLAEAARVRLAGLGESA